MEKKRLILSITAAMIVFALSLFAVPYFVKQLPLDLTAKTCLAEVIGGLLSIAALFFLKKGNTLKFRTEGFKEGMAAGVLILAVFGLNLLKFIFSGEPVTLSAFSIVLFLIDMVFIGIMEEILFRGILQESLHDFFGCDSYKNVLKAVISSSIIFGLAHYMNMFAGVSFKAASIQVLSVILLGTLFGAIYYRAGRNIWVTIILHSLLDLGSFLSSGVLNGVSEAASINDYSFAKFMFFPIYVIVIVWVLRKEKVKLMPTKK